MDEKTLTTLEYPKILERLASYCAFSASAEMARSLRPTTLLHEAQQRLAQTSDARHLLESRPETTIGGARDVRAYANAAARQAVLTPDQLLDIKYTLVAARGLRRFFERQGDTFPHITEIALRLPPPLGLVDAIGKTLSERGEVLDSASAKLVSLRTDLRVQHDRLLSRMQRMLTDPNISPYLQDNLITQRDGRYVIPLQADFKGKVKAIVHDQSASGATLFIEPLSVVEQNNKYRELLLDERDEVRRVLADLSHKIGEYADLLDDMVVTLAELDLAFASAQYAEHLHAVAPEVVAFKKKTTNSSSGQLHPGVVIQLREARHPLIDQETVVPVNLVLDDQTYALIITGPNTGGKTVALKTVGLLVLMVQSGLHIPVQAGSRISVFDKIFADIGDEQSIEQSLSTFSGHITNIIRILKHADAHSLVILDELGAGTDPQEGAALARSLLTHLLNRRITTLVTTHHPELKAYAHATPGVVNASAEFDLQSLQPTFHLTIGLPGRSNALAIAERLGLPKEIVSDARAEIDPDDLRADDMLNEIHRQRDLAREQRQETQNAKLEAVDLRIELAERLEQIEDERRTILEDSRRKTEAEVESVRSELIKLRRDLKHHHQPLEALDAIEKHVEKLENKVELPVERRVPDIAPPAGPILLGAKVRLRTLGNEGIVTALSQEEAEVQIGVLRIRARLAEIVPVAHTGSDLENTQSRGPKISPVTSIKTAHPSPGVELDLRGQRSEDALDLMSAYVEQAYLARLPWVRIIHGKGTGKLRQVVRIALKDHPQVKNFETGGQGEGGDGVTVVHFDS
ncbi:MAG: endonuclease MutS2 [Anaerolineae bacterium]|nr:endonuclease MutS2 [Anaerolineae bacterium]